jgi:hypothetical protein
VPSTDWRKPTQHCLQEPVLVIRGRPLTPISVRCPRPFHVRCARPFPHHRPRSVVHLPTVLQYEVPIEPAASNCNRDEVSLRDVLSQRGPYDHHGTAICLVHGRAHPFGGDALVSWEALTDSLPQRRQHRNESTRGGQLVESCRVLPGHCQDGSMRKLIRLGPRSVRAEIGHVLTLIADAPRIAPLPARGAGCDRVLTERSSPDRDRRSARDQLEEDRVSTSPLRGVLGATTLLAGGVVLRPQLHCIVSTRQRQDADRLSAPSERASKQSLSHAVTGPRSPRCRHSPQRWTPRSC